MSLLMQSRRTSTTKRIKESSEINTRDMSLKKRIFPKAAEHCSDGKAEVTAVWTVDILGKPTRVSFSRDNLGVWINGRGVETKAFLSDQGYDVDLFFDAHTSKCHIYSDVEGDQMMNYLVIDKELMGFDHKDYEVTEKK